MHTALDTIWASLPIPAILVDEGDKIAEINPAAEGFFNTSNRAINGRPVV
jgi:two-component system nitrogen regulation sensor histidine kinase GlnL